MPLFEIEWNKLKSEIDEAFGYHQKADSIGGEEKTIDISELEFLFDALIESMEESDLDRADIIVEELSEYTYPKEQMDLLEEIKIAVLNIDEEQLSNAIEKWRRMDVSDM